MRLGAVAIGVVAAVLAAPAHAYEGELQGAVELGGAVLAGDALSGPGGAATIGVRYGLTDAWALWAGASWALHPDAAPDELVQVGGLGGGIEWVFDVLQVVPWAGLGVEGLVLLGGDEDEPAVALQGSLGLDYLLRRGLAIGLVGRARAVLSHLDEVPLHAIVAARLILTLGD